MNQQVTGWIERAKKMKPKPTHIISVCDTFDYDNYPVFVQKEEDVDKIKRKYDGVNMQKINEVINLKDHI
jgi:hypothetical protein